MNKITLYICFLYVRWNMEISTQINCESLTLSIQHTDAYNIYHFFPMFYNRGTNKKRLDVEMVTLANRIQLGFHYNQLMYVPVHSVRFVKYIKLKLLSIARIL